MKGFVDYNIDYVVKFGGSLLEEKDILRELVKSLGMAAKSGKRIVIIPGGGPTDNTIERLDKWAKFHKNTHHRACALAQDQTGIMLSDIGYEDNLRICDNLEDMLPILEKNCLPILLPSKIIFAINPFEKTWEITSDSMAAWFSWLLNCDKTIILTNVDGIYHNEFIGNESYFISNIKASELISMGHTSVDQCFANFVLSKNMKSWIINGLKPEKVASFFKGDKIICTQIDPS
jgi:aspartokinase-like uncharacterized kinase